MVIRFLCFLLLTESDAARLLRERAEHEEFDRRNRQREEERKQREEEARQKEQRALEELTKMQAIQNNVLLRIVYFHFTEHISALRTVIMNYLLPVGCSHLKTNYIDVDHHHPSPSIHVHNHTRTFDNMACLSRVWI